MTAFNHKKYGRWEMNIHSTAERPIPMVKGAGLEDCPSAIGDFVVGVGGVQNGDVVVDINACNDLLSNRLHQLGARVHKVAGWQSSSSDPMPMASDSTDVIFASMVLHHMRFPTLAIGEMKRVLRPCGRLVIIDRNKYDDVFLKENRKDRWMGFYTGDVRHWLKEAGFSNIIVNPVPYQLLGFDMNQVGSGDGTDIFIATGTA